GAVLSFALHRVQAACAETDSQPRPHEVFGALIGKTVFFRQACLTFRDKNPSCIFCERTDGASKDQSATEFFQNDRSRGDAAFSLAHHERRSVAANRDSSTASNLGGCEIAPRNGGGAGSDSRRDQRRRVGTCR